MIHVSKNPLVIRQFHLKIIWPLEEFTTNPLAMGQIYVDYLVSGQFCLNREAAIQFHVKLSNN